MTPNAETELKPAEVVYGEHEPDDPGHEAVRYHEVRCPQCGRMLVCLRWESVGYPAVNCDAGHFKAYFPFEEWPEIQEAYQSLQ